MTTDDNVLTVSEEAFLAPGGPRREIRAFDREHDYPLVTAWWEARGLCAPPLPALPRDGYFLVIDGAEVVCAWLYGDNRSDSMRMEHIIWDPLATAPDIILAKELLRDFIQGLARDHGSPLVVEEPFATSPLRRLLPAEGQDFIAAFETEIRKLHVMDFPLTHRFTPGMYIRQIFMPAGSLVLSEIHKTEHPYVISQGDVSVWTRESGVVRLRAPYTGITTPGTQRILYIHEDTIWTTFHVTDETDPVKIRAAITEPSTQFLH